MRRLGFVTVVVSLLVAACGSAVQVTQRTRVAQRARPCSGRITLAAGQTVDAWRMGAEDFLSPQVGVGATSPLLNCFVRERSGATNEVEQPQTVMLAVSRDGGARWTTIGVPTPGAAAHGVQELSPEQLVATSSDRAWLVTGTGRVLETVTGGTTWTTVQVPVPAVQMALTRHRLWVLSCAGGMVQSLSCRPALRRMQVSTGAWTRVALPPGPSPTQFLKLAVPTDRTALILVPAGVRPGSLESTTDGGAHWTRRRYPDWQGHPCQNASNVAADGPRTWWLLCLGGAAAGSSDKALLGTTDAGHRWRILSSVDSIIAPTTPGQITLAEPDDLAAGSASRVWLATFFGLTVSGDGGDRWSNVPRDEVETYGDSTTIDDLSATHAWLLAPGGAMWGTTDGVHWRQLGPQHLL